MRYKIHLLLLMLGISIYVNGQLEYEVAADSAKSTATAAVTSTPKKQEPPVFTIFTSTGDTAKAAILGDELYLHVSGELNKEWNKIFLNNLQFDNLVAVEGEKNQYYLKLHKTINQKSFEEIFGVFNESEIPVTVWVGQNRESRYEAGSFNLIVDKHRRIKLIFALSTIASIIFLLIYIINKKDLTFLRDQSNLETAPPFSLARSQFAYWTLIILICYFYVWIYKGSTVNITGDILALLGISAGTTLGGNLMDNRDVRNVSTNRHQDQNNTQSFFLNILSDSNGVSIHRLQNVIFTISISTFLLYEVYINKTIPDLDDELMILMGISSGTYLAVKSGENT